MTRLDRRSFVKGTLLAGLTAATLANGAEGEPAPSKRRFTICLSGGPIGVSGDPRKMMTWASEYGFEGIEPSADLLGKLSDEQLRQFLNEMKSRKLAWGAAGLPVQFRSDDAAFAQGMKSLPAFAKALARGGVTRVATWLTPGSRTLTYLANFRLHAKRLGEAAKVLGDSGLRLGLEYVGPKTSWTSSRFPFIHTMKEMKELIAEIGRDNVGFLLDSWHWYTAQEGEADLLSLKNSDVVLCHLNDAPKGVAVEQQVDNRRELPCATGVIDMKTFLGAMVKIGYDGPVVCEPFSAELRGLKPGESLAKVSAAMKKAIALVE